MIPKEFRLAGLQSLMRNQYPKSFSSVFKNINLFVCICVEAGGQLEGLLLSWGFQGLNTGYQAWWQVLLLARLSRHPIPSVYKQYLPRTAYQKRRCSNAGSFAYWQNSLGEICLAPWSTSSLSLKELIIQIFFLNLHHWTAIRFK